MDAAADYAAVRAALVNHHLPAYVSYVIRSHAGFDAFHGDDTAKVVVRTSDGKVIAGEMPKIKIDSDRDFPAQDVFNGPFKPECYQPVSATFSMYDARPAEAIALHAICREKHAGDHSDDTVFSLLYVDPATRRPIAVVGTSDEQYVKASMAERFVFTGGYVLPESFSVKVAGSGPMFWLNIDGRISYSDYRFLSQQP